MAKIKKVIIEISGGNVQSVWAQDGIEVEIVDYDNLEEEGKDIDAIQAAVETKVEELKMNPQEGY